MMHYQAKETHSLSDTRELMDIEILLVRKDITNRIAAFAPSIRLTCKLLYNQDNECEYSASTGYGPPQLCLAPARPARKKQLRFNGENKSKRDVFQNLFE
jgi:hypothetical protein